MRAAATGWVLAVAAFVTYLKAANQSRNTIRLREYYLGRLSRELGKDPFTEVSMDDLTAWLANDEWSSETRKSARASVVAFYGWAVRAKRVTRDDNPAAFLPAVNVEHAIPRPAPDRVLQQGLWFATERDQMMLMLAGYGGLRRAEIARVHMADFQWDTNELLVHGKGRRQRLVPIHPELRRAVRAELERRAAGEHGTGFRYWTGCTTDGYLFPGHKGHLTADTVGRILDRLLAGPWTGHTLRHRFATKAYSAERDLRAVQELLGHSKPETTARYVATPDEARALAVMAAGLQPEHWQNGRVVQERLAG